MYTKLPKDGNNKSAQVFSPYDIVAITATVAWTPPTNAVAFCPSDDCTYIITQDGVDSESGTLTAGMIRGVVTGLTYTFDTTMSLEVM